MADDDEAARERATKMVEELIKRADSFMEQKHLIAPKKKAKGRRLTEKEEDDLMLKRDTDEDQVTSLQEQPSIITGKMRPYQLEGLNWMIRLYCSGISGIMADEMGLGKTLQSISMLAYMKEYAKSKGPHLVCVPLTVLGNWANEFRRWCPSIKIYKFHGTKDERKEQKEQMMEPDAFEVCLTSYEMACREKSFLGKYKWQFIVVDEAHRLKNESSQLSLVLRTFHSDNRLLITGTPLQNNLHELWALLNFLLPEIFSSAEDFDAMFNTAMEDNILERLQRILRPFMLRRLKLDVEHSLLPKKETLVYVGMSALQAKVYRSVFKREIDAVMGACKERARLLNIVMQLRKAANHPYLFEGIEDRTLPPYAEHLITSSGKISVLDKLLYRLKSRGSRVLIFSQMTRCLDILEDYCVFRGFEYCRIDGSTNTDAREEGMKVFNAPDSTKFVFLLSTRAGGLGINLATADIVVLYDSDWNPQMDLQAQDRAHRIGQKKQVQIYRLITEHTIEEKIIEKAETKLRLDAMVMKRGPKGQKGGAAKSALAKEEMADMIRYGADRVLRITDSTVSDDDIDAILRMGELKTREFTKKLDEKTGGATKLTFDGSVPEKKKEPEEQSDELKAMMERESIMNLDALMGKRERKQNPGYDVNLYYRNALAAPKTQKCMITKPHKLPKMNDFQFFDTARIEKLSEKEQRFFNKHQYSPEPPALSGLSEEETNELDELLFQGFGSWSRLSFRSYLKACELYGRDNEEQIVSHVKDKSPEDVRKYHAVFWKNVEQVANHAKIVSQIEKGEAKLSKTAKMAAILTYSVQGDSSSRPSHESFTAKHVFKYKAVHRGRGFSEREDKHLVYEANRLGFGEWEQLGESCQNNPELAFDYFLKTRSAADLGRRVETLVRINEKDYDQKVGKKRKSPSSPAEPAPSPSPSPPPS